MKISILHISDLHRDHENPISNGVLLDSLQNDRRRYSSEEDLMIKSPDLIIVSGDIIRGIEPNEPEPEKKLRQQYQEALRFLTGLADCFVAGDRERVVIVPGNHDVSAYHFQKSLRRIDILPDRKKELVGQLFSPASNLRWSWATFELYEIADHATYAQRLAAFAEFYAEYYSAQKRTFNLEPSKQFDMFDYPSLGLTVAAFSSCYNNDLYNRQGAIHPTCIADVGGRFREIRHNDRLRLAVWHHNAEGLPTQSDYMDPDLVQNLIDRGVSLGFHGHQHRPQFLDTRFRYGPNRRITVISAGTLCGGASLRFGRSYNVIELDTETRTGRLHVREMQNDNLTLPIWGRRALPPNIVGYYDFEYDLPPEPLVPLNASTEALIDAQCLYDAGNYRKAADTLVKVIAVDDLARPLLLSCYVKLKDSRGIVRYFDPPKSPAEAVHLMDSLWMDGNKQRLQQLVETPIVRDSTDPSIIEMRAKFIARMSR